MLILIIGFSRRGSLSRMLANAGMGVQEGREVDREKRLVSEFEILSPWKQGWRLPWGTSR